MKEEENITHKIAKNIKKKIKNGEKKIQITEKNIMKIIKTCVKKQIRIGEITTEKNGMKFVLTTERKKAEKLKKEGCTNPWSVIAQGYAPKYK